LGNRGRKLAFLFGGKDLPIITQIGFKRKKELGLGTLNFLN